MPKIQLLNFHPFFISFNQSDILFSEESSGFELIYMRMVNFVVPLGENFTLAILVYGES